MQLSAARFLLLFPAARSDVDVVSKERWLNMGGKLPRMDGSKVGDKSRSWTRPSEVWTPSSLGPTTPIDDVRQEPTSFNLQDIEITELHRSRFSHAIVFFCHQTDSQPNLCRELVPARLALAKLGQFSPIVGSGIRPRTCPLHSFFLLLPSTSI